MGVYGGWNSIYITIILFNGVNNSIIRVFSFFNTAIYFNHRTVRYSRKFIRESCKYGHKIHCYRE